MKLSDTYAPAYKLACGAAVEVINAGHAGFGTDNELLFYRQEGQRYAPDVVVLVFNFQNDILIEDRVLASAGEGGRYANLAQCV